MAHCHVTCLGERNAGRPGCLFAAWQAPSPPTAIFAARRPACNAAAASASSELAVYARGGRREKIVQFVLANRAAYDTLRPVHKADKEGGQHESEQKQEVRVHVRWMIRRDMPEVLAIERAELRVSLVDDDFIRCLRQRNCIGMVAEHEDRVVGFMIYELLKTRIHVLNFAVDPHYAARRGKPDVGQVGRQTLAQHRSRIVLEVRETNLSAQLFFRENGFRAVSMLRAYYNDTPEDAYLMQSATGWKGPCNRPSCRAASRVWPDDDVYFERAQMTRTSSPATVGLISHRAEHAIDRRPFDLCQGMSVAGRALCAGADGGRLVPRSRAASRLTPDCNPRCTTSISASRGFSGGRKSAAASLLSTGKAP